MRAKRTPCRSNEKRTSIDIAELSENLIRKHQENNPEKKIKYSGVELPIIHTCRSPIHLIFEELIDNALRFNESEIPEIHKP